MTTLPADRCAALDSVEHIDSRYSPHAQGYPAKPHTSAMFWQGTLVGRTALRPLNTLQHNKNPT
jgi:hypothetical protein